METGVYISENNPLPWGKNISQYQLGEKMWKLEEKKGVNANEKVKKVKWDGGKG
jgi:hypothetical protein